MNAPAMPPPAAPMRARSRTVRFFTMRVWAWVLGRIRVGLEVEVEAKGRVWLWWVRLVVKWFKRPVKSVVVGDWEDGRPREEDILASMVKKK